MVSAKTTVPCARRPGGKPGPEGHGSAALHRSDAGGHTGRDPRDRSRWRHQRRAPGRVDRRSIAPGRALGARSLSHHADAKCPRVPRSSTLTVAGRSSACWEQVSSGKCSRSRLPARAALSVRRPDAELPGFGAAEQLTLDYADPRALERLAECDVVTYEFESVPAEPLEQLAKRVPVYPPPAALSIAQDRLSEKSCFRELGIRTAPFRRGRFGRRAQERSRADRLPRAPENAPLRLRRQGPVPPANASRHRGGARRSAACRSCSRASCASIASSP